MSIIVTHLSDLDELILRCRDAGARSLMAEAVASYKCGALRSSVVATWVAVCFDFMEKLRELALAGDDSAEEQVARLEKIRTSGDVSGALAFERNLLKLARDKFEFISPIEFIDLERLQLDRNRCAHPSLIEESIPYTPSAELVRAHIVAAVDHVLMHPPAQGKFALDRLLSQIDSEYFPVNKDDAIESLRHGPLLKARESLVRNLVIVLLKKYLESAGSDRRRIIAALKAIDFMCPATYEEALARKISPLMRSIPDSSLDSALLPLKNIPKAWGLLEIDVSQRITAYVRALPSKHLENIEWLVESEQFSEAARARISSAGRKELKESIFFGLSAPMADRYIQLYLESESFDQANEWAREIIGYIGDFDQGQMRRLVVEGAQNPEVRGSFRFPDVILAIRKSQKIEVEALDSLIAESGINDD